MCFLARLRRRGFTAFVLLTLWVASLPAWAAERSRFHVDNYQIDAVLNPHDHKITDSSAEDIVPLSRFMHQRRPQIAPQDHRPG